MVLVRHHHSGDDLKLSTRAPSLFRSRVLSICRFCLAIVFLHPSRDSRTHITLQPRIPHGERLERELPLTTNTIPKGGVQDTQWK
jgi:hypothetical protein